GGELGLTGTAVTDESDVPDAGRVVHLHRRGPPERKKYPHHIQRRDTPQALKGPSEGGAAVIRKKRPSFVSERLNRVEPRGFERGIHAEKQADRRGEAEADGE